MKNIKIHHILYLGLLLFLGYSLLGSFRLFLKARQNLADAQTLLESQSEVNSQLHQQLVDVGKQIYVERVARDTLGLARENEVVFVLPAQEEVKNLSPRLLMLQSQPKIQPEKPHWREWVDLFL